MFSDPNTSHNGTSSVSYSCTSRGKARSEYTKSGSTPADASFMVIQHSTKSSSVKDKTLIADVHNINVRRRKLTTGIDETASFSVTGTIPRSGVFSSTEVKELLQTIENMLTGATTVTSQGSKFDQLLLGEH